MPVISLWVDSLWASSPTDFLRPAEIESADPFEITARLALDSARKDSTEPPLINPNREPWL